MKTEEVKIEEGLVVRKTDFRPSRKATKKVDMEKAKEIIKKIVNVIKTEKTALEIETAEFLKAVGSSGTKGSTANAIARKIMKDLDVKNVGLHVDDEKMIFYPK